MKTKKAILLVVIPLLIASFMLATGCAQEVTTSTGFRAYSKYGFSFEYPKTYSVTEMGMLQSEADEASGAVQAALGYEEMLQVIWLGIQ